MDDTLAPDSAYGEGGSVYKGTYIKRAADDRLFELCQQGEYASVLATRQIGKSSLMDATILRLDAVGIRTVRLDLNLFGTPENPQEWFLGLLTAVADGLELKFDHFGWWEARSQLGVTQRMSEFFEKVLLVEVAARVVIFVDEVDTTLALKYTDDFFAAIRSLYIARQHNPALARLSFVLLGVATPGELVKDPNRTPYNIGEQIEMTDFTLAEAAPLADGLTCITLRHRQAVLERVLYWTGGHPYLTGKALKRLNELGQTELSQREIDAQIEGLFMGTLSNADQQVEFVRKMLVNQPPRIPVEETPSLLEMYQQVWKKRRIADEKQSRVKSHLKLSGAVRVRQGYFEIRNLIYRTVFNERWVKKQTEPVLFTAALRRLAPVLLAGTVGFIIVALLGVIAFVQFQSAESERSRAVTAEADANNKAVTSQALAQVAQNEKNKVENEKENALNAIEAIASARGKGTKVLNNIALSVLAAYHSRTLLETNPDQALLLGVQSIRFNDNLQSYRALRAVLNLASPELRAYLSSHSDFVTSVTFSPDGKTLASASADKTIKLWDTTTRQLLRTLTGHSAAVWSVAFSPDGRTLASASDDKTIKLWDSASGQLLRTLTGHSATVYSVTFSPDGRTLASASNDKTIKLWDSASGQLLRTLTGHSSSVWSIAFSPDGKTLASASADNTIKLWDSASGPLLRTLTGHSSSVWSVAFSPDGKTLASASADNTIILWDSASGQLLRTLTDHSATVYSVVFSPDGKTLASASSDNTIKLWDSASGQLLRTLTDHSDSVISVVFSPDGKILASASDDNTIKLWDTVSGQLLRTLTDHSIYMPNMAFSPDGKILASASDDNTIKLWDTVSGQLLRTLTGHTASVNSVAFSPDGKTLATASNDNTIKLWKADEAVLPQPDCSTLRRNLTWAEWQKFIATDESYQKTCPDYPLPSDLPAKEKQQLEGSPTLTPGPTAIPRPTS
jgi:WD40 repeat protein